MVASNIILHIHIFLVVAIFFFIGLLYYITPKRPRGVPPGPGFCLPFIGHLHLLGKNPRLQVEKWRKLYGNVFSVFFGSKLIIIINRFSVLREAFAKRGDVFSDRPRMVMGDKISKYHGNIVLLLLFINLCSTVFHMLKH